MKGLKVEMDRFKLKKLINWICDSELEFHEGTDEEVRAELEEMGVDVDESFRKFKELLASLTNKTD